MIHILVVEDDEKLNRFVCTYLGKSGFLTKGCLNAQEAYQELFSKPCDLIISDIMMPEVDGFEFARTVREWNRTIPILFMSAKDDLSSKQKGFNIGIDDYIVKPFDAKEVIARINAVTRRVGTGMAEPESKEVHYDKLSVNMTRYELRVNGKNIDTPPKELELLYYLASNPNRVFTRDQLLDEVWGFEYYGDSRTIDVHIKRLREKLEGVSPEWTLRTVWGIGYKFEVDEEE